MENIKKLITSKKAALARDRYGCTPLHNAIVFEQTEIIRYIAANFSSVLNAPDYVNQTFFVLLSIYCFIERNHKVGSFFSYDKPVNGVTGQKQ